MRFGWVEVAVALTLALLLAHAGFYWFLTDDAFISFRYARNLSEGHGLVFNPGQERVEGYTNFLWVVILATLHRVGLPPEVAAPVLGMAATVVLWGLVVFFAWRGMRETRPRWILLVAPLLLASTRSVAVWSTSGLETRLFEVLIVAGVLRLVVETEARQKGHAPKSVAPLLLALATLTRPDGLLISGAVLTTAWAWLAFRRRFDGRACAFQCGLYGLVVGAHLAFRIAYYGAWLPNTYYAKVSGTWWGMGAAYLGEFVLEYAAYLWLPLLAAAIVAHARRGTLSTPLLFAAAVVPHALWVASIGGDHFEYRPLDLYFPFAFLLGADGVGTLSRSPRAARATAAYLVVLLLGLVELPLQSHLQFVDHYQSGFPGQFWDFPASLRFLRPERDPIYRLPGLRAVGEAYRRLLWQTTAQFVGIRQEEHRMFLDTVVPEGKHLARLVATGRLPADFHLAISCVGAIPYYSDLRVLDRFGLTDAHVARSVPPAGTRVMAHEKRAEREYALGQGVDFWALDPVHSLVDAGSLDWSMHVQRARAYERRARVYAADLGDGFLLVGEPLQGLEPARQRLPGLTFRPFLERETLIPILRTAAERLGGDLRLHPDDDRLRIALGDVLALLDDYPGQIEAYEPAAPKRSADPYFWYSLFLAYRRAGRLDDSTEAARRAVAAMEELGDAAHVDALKAQIQRAAGVPTSLPGSPRP